MKKISFKSVILSSFKSFPVKFIILETSLVGDFIRLKPSIFSAGFILFELSLVEGTVGEDIGSFSTSSSIIKLPQEESSILSEHPSETVRSGSLHARWFTSLSREPTYVSSPYFITLGFFSVWISCWNSSKCFKSYFGGPGPIELVECFGEGVRWTELIELYLLNGHNPPDLGLRRTLQSSFSVALCAAHLIAHQIKYCISYQH